MHRKIAETAIHFGKFIFSSLIEGKYDRYQYRVEGNKRCGERDVDGKKQSKQSRS